MFVAGPAKTFLCCAGRGLLEFGVVLEVKMLLEFMEAFVKMFPMVLGCSLCWKGLLGGWLMMLKVYN